jgi:hypothetical protein
MALFPDGALEVQIMPIRLTPKRAFAMISHAHCGMINGIWMKDITDAQNRREPLCTQNFAGFPEALPKR